ncbi:MAG: hypothetical protein BRC41_16415 [Cyanobacteria bacterium QH_9_48_43]|nr:MAG: hypothetical protein BRC44_14325 [Cyanobacteria bacterium QS_4_48_99]PSO80836.1 MAG: hypothetical protein BRC41_16415 [Cyanobacteria bacterium QH_9_48_43]PSO83635.1 MAG: hypothetical protein BRC45_07335 [Cyanobacteria bacterium QS_5_48_63]PSO86211.1 MAG: hypothetical protein BRC43_11930 [Cyanobacteria bacterium QS_3_48_167]PSO96628.1 MAG: hypothetical protein BRC48_06265 [Cyanobacteria bacterium QS_9_48_30]PSO96767.1 MAG: hypothetical protein BRC46_00395 [Cyanobacteria bacterium QS_6_4
MTLPQQTEPVVYQGHFGEFTINQGDRVGVIIYRAGLMVAALSFALGSFLVLWQGTTPVVLQTLTFLYGMFSLSLGVSLVTVHIYLLPLHRLLQIFWLIGTVAAAAVAWQSSEPLALSVYHRPMALFGVGFIFAALTGIYFKEAFCFNRLETKLLTPLVPLLLLGHLAGILSPAVEQVLLASYSLLFIVFALRKAVQPTPPDIGDKSVFEYLKQQRAAKA